MRFKGHSVPICLLAAASMAPAAPAWAADCPQEFGAGIVVVSDDGGTARLTRDARGLLIETVVFDDDEGAVRTESVDGVFVLLYVDLDEAGQEVADTREVITPDVGLDQIPAMAAGLSWTGGATSRFEGETDRIEVTINVGFEETRSYGTCSYTVLPVTLREQFDTGEDYVAQLDFVPALGVALLRATGDFGQPADMVVTPVSVRAMD